MKMLSVIILLAFSFIHAELTEAEDTASSGLSSESLTVLSNLDKEFPSLKDQVLEVLASNKASIDPDKSLRSLAAFLSSKAQLTIREDMRMLLQPEIYNGWNKAASVHYEINGNDEEWSTVPERTDQAGDNPGTAGGSDLVSAKAAFDSDSNLYVCFRTKLHPVKKQYFDLLIDSEAGFGYDFEIIAYQWTDGKLYATCNDLRREKSGMSADIKVAISGAYELSIPFATIAGKSQIRDTIRLLPRIISFDSKSIDEGPVFTLVRKPVNIPLALLLHAAEEELLVAGDNVSIAIPLAASWLYSVSSAETKARILIDMEKQFGFYGKIVSWQKEKGLPYSLDRAGLLPKMLWSDRMNNFVLAEIDESIDASADGTLGIDAYTEFIDSIEVLDAIHTTIVEKNLADASIATTASQCEAYVHSVRKYRSSMENLSDFRKIGIFSEEDAAQAKKEYDSGEYYTEYRGKKRRWDAFGWLNYQYGLFAKIGAFRGDCGTTTILQMAFFRASGIAAVSFQWVDRNGNMAYTHNFPGYFHPRYARWFSIQKPLYPYLGKNDRGFDQFFHFSKPITNPWRFNYDLANLSGDQKATFRFSHYQGELSESKTIAAFLTLGWGLDDFIRVFKSDDTLRKGLIIGNITPAMIADADADSIPDLLEKISGTNKNEWDTDQDGYSDAWELEYGYEPLDKKSPAAYAFDALDGFVLSAPGSKDSIIVADPKGDVRSKKEVYDIAAVVYRLEGDGIYAGVQYYNDIKANTLAIHSFQIRTRGKTPKSLWVQWSGPDYSQVYSVEGESYIPIGSVGLKKRIARDAEFFIPLSYLGEPGAFYIKYFGCGYYDAKEQIADDSTRETRIAVDKSDRFGDQKNLFADALSSVDEENDCTIKKNAFDIKNLKIRILDSEFYVFADYYNDTSANPEAVHTIYLRDEDGKLNYWLQWWSLSGFALYVWTDGKESVLVKTDEYEIDSDFTGKAMIFSFPVGLFGKSRSFVADYRTGCPDATGDLSVNNDISAKVRIELEKVGI